VAIVHRDNSGGGACRSVRAIGSLRIELAAVRPVFSCGSLCGGHACRLVLEAVQHFMLCLYIYSFIFLLNTFLTALLGVQKREDPNALFMLKLCQAS
jgi:hypothetical protein